MLGTFFLGTLNSLPDSWHDLANQKTREIFQNSLEHFDVSLAFAPSFQNIPEQCGAKQSNSQHSVNRNSSKFP